MDKNALLELKIKSSNENKKQELIGVFMVVDNKRKLKKVVVSQDIITHYSGETSYKKNFYLETIDGLEVYNTSDPDLFKLPDGSTLRRKKVK